ncbi:hypothetical protein M634_13175 [Vibrio parahaemolyticus O1:Kuk str. FDA_R31]|uniref:hypothetical protein n=1 Tax=Vibrio harveyi group TaxID=717610 RepID=UPI0003590724|nr:MULTISPECIES: hypothetical protein [Vibrio harveyi group]AGQ92434.1 hypothetical protein M634_13175 [Vibrio parahaemolyticus O1:Kuk str. FDA_R31]EGQ9163911.1 hypothetical protein [Vibrio parahaemolyticus]MCR9569976.1 hypothetical protein [Vibrio alginolyticus]ODW68698.1 hypothetical protein BBL89_08515 [Vibrio parahaemolyticus]ODW70781.1 hypothetical protein BBL90_08175 [Vibrio parahaemolyticus]
MREDSQKLPVENCINIQYIFRVSGKGIDMSKEKQLFQQALEVIIDGVAVSHQTEGRAEAGVLLMRELVAKYPHLIDADKVTAIQSIIEMADEVESPIYRL